MFPLCCGGVLSGNKKIRTNTDSQVQGKKNPRTDLYRSGDSLFIHMIIRHISCPRRIRLLISRQVF